MNEQFPFFCWHEIHSQDPEASIRFYTEVVGWTVGEMEMNGAGPYVLFRDDEGAPQMGLIKASNSKSAPRLLAYLAVSDVDLACTKVTDAGGKVIAEPQEIPVGRFAVVADPQGAVIAPFVGKNADAKGSTQVHWNELWAPDTFRSATFYEEAFGLSSESMNMPGSVEPYTLFKHGQSTVGGALGSPNPSVPALWIPYIRVADVEETMQRAQARGAESLGPVQSVPNIGNFGVVREGQGTSVGFITPASPSD